MSIAAKFEVIADKVFEAGKKSEHDRLWDTLQKNGGPANYYYKFAYGSFTDDTYNPIYPLRFTSSTNAAQNVFYATDITDTKVPIHAEGCDISGMFYRYGSAQPLKTIRELHVDEKTIININTFTRTDNLENITFVGSIACDLIINWSKKLTKASITSIINALSDSENISGKEVRLSKTAVNNAFGINIDDNTTWSDEWKNLITNKIKKCNDISLDNDGKWILNAVE